MKLILVAATILFFYQAQAKFSEKASETTVSRVTIGLVQAKRLNETEAKKWLSRSETIQEQVSATINSQSYLEAIKDSYNIPLNVTPAQYVMIGKWLKVDGIFAFEARTKDLRVVLRSGRSGLALSTWSFPYQEPLSDADVRRLAKEISASIIADFPYIGYVRKVSGDKVLINLGKKFRTTEGTVLQVFEFEDENPNFSSPKTVLGKIEVTKVANNGALAQINRSSTDFHSYAKLEPYVKEKEMSLDSSLRYFEGFWMGAGPQFTLLDTNTADDVVSASRRYRITLTPLYKFFGGYGPFMAQVVYGNFNQDGHKNTYVNAQMQYDVYLFDLAEKWKSYSAVGLSLSSYLANTGNLVSSNIYSAFLDQGLYYRVGSNTRVFGGLQLHYPAFSSDPQDGSIQGFSSYAFAGYAGLRVQVTPSFAFEGLILNRITNWSFPNRKIQELSFTSSFNAIYLL